MFTIECVWSVADFPANASARPVMSACACMCVSAALSCSAAATASLIGLSLSLVLSTFPNPNVFFVISCGLSVSALCVSTRFFNAITKFTKV